MLQCARSITHTLEGLWRRRLPVRRRHIQHTRHAPLTHRRRRRRRDAVATICAAGRRMVFYMHARRIILYGINSRVHVGFVAAAAAAASDDDDEDAPVSVPRVATTSEPNTAIRAELAFILYRDVVRYEERYLRNSYSSLRLT